VKKEIG